MVTAAGLALALGLGGGAAAGDAAEPVEFRVGALVQAKVAAFKPVPATARIDPTALSTKRRELLKAAPGFPVKAPEVTKALQEARQSLARDDRTKVARALDAIGEWVAEHVEEEAGGSCPDAWRDAARTIRDRKGNGFERLRVLVTLARAAGIPARPSFNGTPVAQVYAAARGGEGAWTTWAPLVPSASVLKLPLAWLPLRAEEVAPVRVEPAGGACEAAAEVRRYTDRDAASRALAAIRSTGSFPSDAAPPLPAESSEWWEVWRIGGTVAGPEGSSLVATVALPFVPDLSAGTREHAVWVSVPSRLVKTQGPLSETDQQLGGLRYFLKLTFSPG